MDIVVIGHITRSATEHGQLEDRGDQARHLRPALNRSYAELAAHYGCLIDPARAMKPKDKPRVERPMPYVRDSMWSGRDWAGEPDMQAGALRVVHRGGRGPSRTARSTAPRRSSVFAATETAGAASAAAGAFRAGDVEHAQGRARLLRQGRARPSTPCRGASSARHLDAREGDRTVEFYVEAKVVKTWATHRQGQADRLGRLPAREGGVLHAHPAVVPPSRPASSAST